MNIEKIEAFVKESFKSNTAINVHFKGRTKVTGLFIRTNDYNELKGKNFWRIVDISRIKQWHKTKDVRLARIFSGNSFSVLTRSKA